MRAQWHDFSKGLWSVGGNRFINRAGTNVTIPIGGARVVMYSGELQGWIPIAEVP